MQETLPAGFVKFRLCSAACNGRGASFWKCLPRALFVFAVRGGKRQFRLAETCQPGDSTPRFLAAQRSAVSSRREEIAVVALAAQHNTRVCGPLCDPRGSSQAMPSLSSASTVFASTLFLDCNCNPVCSSYNDLPAEQLIWRSFAAARHFCSAKILAGGDCGGAGVPSAVGNSSPRAKKFPEEICFAPSRVCQICRTPD